MSRAEAEMHGGQRKPVGQKRQQKNQSGGRLFDTSGGRTNRAVKNV
jgi:hypothetical protein